MSDEKKGKNEVAWELLFKKYNILKEVEHHHTFIIQAEQIKEFREPRLMAKFDHKINLPRIFTDNQLAILPVSRGAYCISHFDCYQRLESVEAPVHQCSLPQYIQSIDPVNISSETISVHCALAAGIFADFTGDEGLMPTVSGRMGSGAFDFAVSSLVSPHKIPLSVKNAQIEIDAALEGKESLVLVEAKHDISQDFIIRQLFYPFQTWSRRVAKKVRPLFFIFSNSIFSLYEYEFTNKNDYNSLVLIKHKNYSLERIKISWREIHAVASTVQPCDEPPIPFPQADNFPRIINLCEILCSKRLSRDEVTQEYAFDVRQTNYYTDAGRYLGLISKEYRDKTPIYALTEKCLKILSYPYTLRQLALCSCILEHKAFLRVFNEYLQSGIMPAKARIVCHMKQSNLFHVDSESTYHRRASTISSWLEWIISLTTA